MNQLKALEKNVLNALTKVKLGDKLFALIAGLNSVNALVGVGDAVGAVEAIAAIQLVLGDAGGGLVADVTALETAIDDLEAAEAAGVGITTSTPTGANQVVTLTGVANATQVIAAHGTAPTGTLELVLPVGDVGREFTVVNNSVLTSTVKGKTADTGIDIATTKTAKVLVLADNTVKRITADI